MICSNNLYKNNNEDYVPGIKIQDFAPRGRVSRIKGKTTNRVHHLLSDLETNVFYLLDFEEKITDIKEHYPLLDLHEVVDDLSVRNETELYRDLLLEKLEVERRYWSKKGIRWFIVTNKDIPMNKVNNIKWLYLGDIDIEYEKEIERVLWISKELDLVFLINIFDKSWPHEAKLSELTVFINENKVKSITNEVHYRLTVESELSENEKTKRDKAFNVVMEFYKNIGEPNIFVTI